MGSSMENLPEAIHKLAENWYDVVAKKAAEDTASIWRLLLSALYFAAVVDYVVTDFNCNANWTLPLLHAIKTKLLNSKS